MKDVRDSGRVKIGNVDGPVAVKDTGKVKIGNVGGPVVAK